MEESSWKETLLQSLEERDARELLSAEIYDAYAKLASLYATLRTQGSPGTTSSAAPISQNDDITTLRAQIAELYKTQNTHLQTIKSLESGLSSMQQAEGQLKRELSDLRTRRRDLELRAALHGETLREKNQQIQLLQDELLTTGLSLTLLEEKAQKLEQENKELLARWLAKTKNDVDAVNEANEFMTRMREVKVSSPVTEEGFPAIENRAKSE